MEASELRIGNLVYYNGQHNEIGPINGIVSYITGHTNILLNHRRDISYSVNEIKPIPLTEEWLINLGFRETQCNCQILFMPMPELSSELHVYKNDFVFEFINSYGRMIVNQLKYVHQLQNLYFVLTSRELTLKNIKNE